MEGGGGGCIESVHIKGVEFRENERVYFHPGQKKKVSVLSGCRLKRSSTVLRPCPTNCFVDLYVALITAGDRNDGRPFSEKRRKIVTSISTSVLNTFTLEANWYV